MLEWAIQCVVITGVLGAVFFVLCKIARLRPAVCHLLWLIVLVKLVTPPINFEGWPPDWVRDAVQQTAGMGQTGQQETETTPPRHDATLLELKLAYQPTSDWKEFEAEMESREYDGAVQPTGSAGGESTLASSGASEKTESPVGEPRPVGSETETTESGGPVYLPAATAMPPQAGPPSASRMTGWALLIIWLAGTLVSMIIHGRRVLIMRGLVNSSQEAPNTLVRDVKRTAALLDIRPPRVRIANLIGSPVVCAIGQPVLLWPASLSPDSPGTDGVIAHELAHLRRRDHWFAWLELITTCLWWWNPMQWIARRQFRHYAELAADAWVIWLQPQRRRAYAEALIEVSSRTTPIEYAAPVLGVATSSRRAFERRLSMIMRDRLSCRISPAIAIAAALLSVAVLPNWSIGSPTTDVVVSSEGRVSAAVEHAVKLHTLNNKMHTAIKKEDWERVAKTAGYLAEMDPDNGEARHWLGYSLISLGDTEAGREAFIAQAKLGHEIGKAAYNISCTYALEDEVDKAFKYLDKATKAGFDNSELIAEDTDLDSLREDARFEKIVNRLGNIALIEEAADAARESGEWEDAATGYAKLAELQPYRSIVFHRLGYARIVEGDVEGAMKAFEHELELDEDNSTALYNMACCYARMDKPEPALRYLADAIENGFNRIDLIEEDSDLDNIRDSAAFETVANQVTEQAALVKNAKSAFEEQDWSASAEAWATVAEVRPEWGSVYHHLGFSLHQLGEYDAAIEAFTKEAEYGESLPRSLYNIACGYAQTGDTDTSLAHLEYAVETGFDQLELLQTDSDLESLHGDKRFVACVRQVGDKSVLSQFGGSDWSEVRAIHQEKVEEDAEDGGAWLALGFAHLRLGDHDAAMKAFKNQKECGFAENIALYNMACVYADLDEAEQSLEMLAMAVEAGFNQADFARSDPDMASVRNHRTFEEILAKCEMTAEHHEEGEYKDKEESWDEGDQKDKEDWEAKKKKEKDGEYGDG